jgi:hypothetical protein
MGADCLIPSRWPGLYRVSLLPSNIELVFWYPCPVRCHIELTCWLTDDGPLTEGECERLVLTLSTYLNQAGGKPDIKAYLGEKLLCITASSLFESSSVIRDRKADMTYIRDAVIAALKEAGMLEEGS